MNVQIIRRMVPNKVCKLKKVTKKFEKDIIEKVKSEKQEIIDSIQASGKLEENTEKLLTQLIEEYKKNIK